MPDSAPTPRSLASRTPAAWVWGAGTAAAQIEGSVAVDGRSPSIWDTFAALPGRTANGDTPTVACDHYARVDEDLELIAALGVDAYRFSVSWSRIVPTPGGHNPRGLDFYDRLVDGLLARGVAPYVTLYHWDLPQWAQDRGGWTNRDTVDRFAEYADVVAAAIGDRVAAWTTVNEPAVSVFAGHLDGIHAPGIRDAQAAVRAMHHTLLAHGTAVEVLRRAPEALVGLSLNLAHGYPASDSPADMRALERWTTWKNWLFLDPVMSGRYPDALGALLPHEPPVHEGDMARIATPIDFLGVNYYTRAVISDDADGGPSRSRSVPQSGAHTAMGWEVHPGGLHALLHAVHERHPGLPMIVSENGSAWDDVVSGAEVAVEDRERTDYLLRHVDATLSAAEDGVPVRGYFAWSLMDNFEWSEGYDKRFGLIHVDYPTGRRRWKRSAVAFRDLVTAARGDADPTDSVPGP